MSSVGSRAMRTPHRKRFSAIPFLLACLHGQKNSIPDPGRSQEAWNDSNTRVWTYSAADRQPGSVAAGLHLGRDAGQRKFTREFKEAAVRRLELGGDGSRGLAEV